MACHQRLTLFAVGLFTDHVAANAGGHGEAGQAPSNDVYSGDFDIA